MAEVRGPAGVSKLLNATWIRPFLFLIFIVVAWDLTIRIFHIPQYQIPAPADVVAVLWNDWPELLAASVADHLCHGDGAFCCRHCSGFPWRC